MKLANIHLTPEKPSYSGGAWHVEGMENESIVASGLYYYHSENISESRLAFRADMAEPIYEQNDSMAVDEVYGLGDSEPLNVHLGSVVTQQGRCVAFSNQLQHQVQPFCLDDPLLPGSRKICALFLVDPNKRILSTGTVPPQQRDWLRQELLMMRPFMTLPRAVLDKVIGYLDYPMDWNTACKHRDRLMAERSTIVRNQNKEIFERPFSLCEH